MPDPLPLIEEGVSPFETELLRAGRSDSLSSRSRNRIMAGLGIGGSLLAATSVASGLKATTAKSFLSTLGLGATVGAVGALAVWAGVLREPPSVVPHEPRAKVAQQPVPTKLSQAPETPVTEEPALAPEASEPKQATKLPAPVRGATASDSLALELAAIEQARDALGRRDYAQALSLLDDYTRRFSKRHLNSEATVLRIETLSAKGDREAAARLGKSFLAGHPNGPYARRVRSLVGDP
jgi:hypothetical protein